MNKIVKATAVHVERLVPVMRAADVEELSAGLFESPRYAALMSLTLSSEAYTWLRDGEVVAVFGIAPVHDQPGTGCPWMLGTDRVKKNARYLLQNSPRIIARFQEDYPLLENRVHAKNKLAIRWLKWCGFSFDEAEPFGPKGELFITFHKERPCAS